MVTIVLGIGYIGSGLIQELLYQGREVIGLDNLFSTDRRAIEAFGQSPTFRFVEGSIVDPAALDRVFRQSEEIEAVYLLAAQASAHPDAASAAYTEEANLRGPRMVLDAMTRSKVHAPLVYASSIRVYGSPLPSVVTEDTPYGAFSDLAHLSKAYVEKLLEFYAHTRRLDLRVVRLGLTYGVAPVMKVDPRFMTAPNLFAYQAGQGKPLTVRSSDYLAIIHVADAVAALLAAGERADQPGYAVFNAATEITTISEIAEQIRELATAREIEVTIQRESHGPARPAERPLIHSAFRTGCFVPRHTLGQGLAETFDHFLVRLIDTRSSESSGG